MEDGLSLDAGALVALERGRTGMREVIEGALVAGRELHVVPGVLAQVWRGGPRQATLARLFRLPNVILVSLGPDTAKLVGELVGLTGHRDVTDVHVALHARQHRHAVVTSDPDDIRAVDPTLTIIEV